ncbi:MAG TPA: glycosyltransferase family 4 protein [Candidatus Polarisedimenticolia bacterium]|nr:glycosyltransferase family 4 protein [Candidatus Polarisedimenticolia bacterium]
MKVLESNFHRGWGGQPSRILMVAEGMARRGHDVTLAVPPGSILGERARAAGLRTFEEAHFRHPRHFVRALADRRALARHLEEVPYDLVVAHGSQDLWTAVLARGASGRTPLAYTRHNTKHVDDHALNRWLFRRVDHLIVVSASILPRYEPFFARGDLRRDRVSVVHSAYRPERFHAGIDPRTFRASIGAPPDAPLVGVVGRLVPDKGQDDFLRAAAILRARRPDLHFLLAGRGTAEADLRRLAADLGVEDAVAFLGFRDDVPEITASLAVSVLPSVDCDASSAAIKEALACGVPVVATDIGGASEIVREGETGFVVPPRDPARLAEAIDRLLADPAGARAMGRRGADDMAARFTPDHLVDGTLAAYESILAGARRAAAS